MSLKIKDLSHNSDVEMDKWKHWKMSGEKKSVEAKKEQEELQSGCKEGARRTQRERDPWVIYALAGSFVFPASCRRLMDEME